MRLLLSDLQDETEPLVALLSQLEPGHWLLPTPATGWSVTDQVSHLAYFDEAAALAATDPDRFRREADELVKQEPDFTTYVAESCRSIPPHQLLDWFKRSRAEYVQAFAQLGGGTRLPWYGPPMSAASSVTARLMETWAHGLDIADTLGITVAPSSRLRHVAHLGVRTFAFSFEVHGLEAPKAGVYVELVAPDGAVWTWGEPTAPERITGSAWDFCLVVAQRRHLDDTDLVAIGSTATQWMAIAQAFAGPPGIGRPGHHHHGESSDADR
jgi:uncharacterized protein (TIGR03084 family)